MGESALVVAVPEAEHAVARFRINFVESASRGVPAHITLIYPFAPTDQLAVIEPSLRALFSRFSAQRFQLVRLDQFGDEMLYLAPEPATCFTQMTDALVRRYPEWPPYGGDVD